MNLSGDIRSCPNCTRHTQVEHVPAETMQEPSYVNNVRVVKTVMVIPGYTVCTWCGWCFGYDDTTTIEPTQPEPLPPACVWCGGVIKPLETMTKIVQGQPIHPLCKACYDTGETPLEVIA